MPSFLSPSSISRWRVLSTYEGWTATKHFDKPTRRLLSRLDPPFNPDREIIVFTAPIANGFFAPPFRITKLAMGSKHIADGWLTATGDRLIASNNKNTLCFQLLYPQLRSVSSSNDTFTLLVNNGSSVTLTLQFPGPSLIAPLIAMSSPQSQMGVMSNENRKQDKSELFLYQWAGFFLDIVDENKSRE